MNQTNVPQQYLDPNSSPQPNWTRGRVSLRVVCGFLFEGGGGGGLCLPSCLCTQGRWRIPLHLPWAAYLVCHDGGILFPVVGFQNFWELGIPVVQQPVLVMDDSLLDLADALENKCGVECRFDVLYGDDGLFPVAAPIKRELEEDCISPRGSVWRTFRSHFPLLGLLLGGGIPVRYSHQEKEIIRCRDHLWQPFAVCTSCSNGQKLEGAGELGNLGSCALDS